MMRNRDVWGKDATVFRPERWLEGNPDQIAKRELDVEMCFGYGKYQCLGKNIAGIELNKVFVEVSEIFHVIPRTTREAFG